MVLFRVRRGGLEVGFRKLDDGMMMKQ